MQRRARRKLTPAPWLVPVTPDVARRLPVIQREWQRVDPQYPAEVEQRFWATPAGRPLRFFTISENEITCTPACSYVEEFAVTLPEGELRARPRGLVVVFAAASGAVAPYLSPSLSAATLTSDGLPPPVPTASLPTKPNRPTWLPLTPP